jgi:hypothetical protein
MNMHDQKVHQIAEDRCCTEFLSELNEQFYRQDEMFAILFLERVELMHPLVQQRFQ